MKIVDERNFPAMYIHRIFRTVVLVHLEKIAVVACRELNVQMGDGKSFALEGCERGGEKIESSILDHRRILTQVVEDQRLSIRRIGGGVWSLVGDDGARSELTFVLQHEFCQ